jgi:small subunit ribosomal protein S17
MKTTKQGVVIRKIDDKTAVVETFMMKVHPIYKKRFKIVKKYLSHDPKNQYKEGDIVLIKECLPVSKSKRFQISEKIGSKYVKEDKIVGEEVLGAERPVQEESKDDGEIEGKKQDD